MQCSVAQCTLLYLLLHSGSGYPTDLDSRFLLSLPLTFPTSSPSSPSSPVLYIRSQHWLLLGSPRSSVSLVLVHKVDGATYHVQLVVPRRPGFAPQSSPAQSPWTSRPRRWIFAASFSCGPIFFNFLYFNSLVFAFSSRLSNLHVGSKPWAGQHRDRFTGRKRKGKMQLLSFFSLLLFPPPLHTPHRQVCLMSQRARVDRL